MFSVRFHKIHTKSYACQKDIKLPVWNSPIMRMEHEGTDGNFIPLWDALDFTVKSLLFESWLDYEISLVLSGSFFIQSVGNKKILCALPFPQFISINVGFRISFLSLKVATGGIKRIIWVRSSLLAYFPGRVNELTPVSVTYKDQYSKLGSRRWSWKFQKKHFLNPKPELLLQSSYRFWPKAIYHW